MAVAASSGESSTSTIQPLASLAITPSGDSTISAFDPISSIQKSVGASRTISVHVLDISPLPRAKVETQKINIRTTRASELTGTPYKMELEKNIAARKPKKPAFDMTEEISVPVSVKKNSITKRKLSDGRDSYGTGKKMKKVTCRKDKRPGPKPKKSIPQIEIYRSVQRNLSGRMWMPQAL